MPVPNAIKGQKKPQAAGRDRANAPATPKQANVRPHVAELIKKVIEENAPTWKALAKR